MAAGRHDKWHGLYHVASHSKKKQAAWHDVSLSPLSLLFSHLILIIMPIMSNMLENRKLMAWRKEGKMSWKRWQKENSILTWNYQYQAKRFSNEKQRKKENVLCLMSKRKMRTSLTLSQQEKRSQCLFLFWRKSVARAFCARIKYRKVPIGGEKEEEGKRRWRKEENENEEEKQKKVKIINNAISEKQKISIMVMRNVKYLIGSVLSTNLVQSQRRRRRR